MRRSCQCFICINDYAFYSLTAVMSAVTVTLIYAVEQKDLVAEGKKIKVRLKMIVSAA